MDPQPAPEIGPNYVFAIDFNKLMPAVQLDLAGAGFQRAALEGTIRHADGWTWVVTCRQGEHAFDARISKRWVTGNAAPAGRDELVQVQDNNQEEEEDHGTLTSQIVVWKCAGDSNLIYPLDQVSFQS